MNARLSGLGAGVAAAAALAIGLTLALDLPRPGTPTAAWPVVFADAPRMAVSQPRPAPLLPRGPLTNPPERPDSLAARVERLRRSDAPRDAFVAFGLLARCVRAREFDTYLKSLPMERGLDALRANYGNGQRLLREACGDLSMTQLVARIELAEKAARGAIPGAASAWIEQGPFGDKSALEQRPDDPLVAEWVRQAIAWVNSAARREDIEAIIQFGMLSLNWELSDTERVNVLVHAATQRDLEDQLQRLARRDALQTESGERTPP